MYLKSNTYRDYLESRNGMFWKKLDARKRFITKQVKKKNNSYVLFHASVIFIKSKSEQDNGIKNESKYR